MSSGEVYIRKAEKRDCRRMLELIKELAHYERALHQVTVSLEAFEDAGFGADAVWSAYVAEQENVIIGLSLFYIRYSTWKGRKLYLEDIIVTEKFRGKGIGKRLFETTLDYGKRTNCHGMVWQVLDWNEPAINFYRKYNAAFDGEWLNGSIDY